MPLYIYLASMAIGVSIPVVVWSLNGTRGYGAQVRRNLSQGIVRPVTSIVGRRQRHRRFLPQRYVSDIEHRLDRAGLAADVRGSGVHRGGDPQRSQRHGASYVLRDSDQHGRR